MKCKLIKFVAALLWIFLLSCIDNVIWQAEEVVYDLDNNKVVSIYYDIKPEADSTKDSAWQDVLEVVGSCRDTDTIVPHIYALTTCSLFTDAKNKLNYISIYRFVNDTLPDTVSWLTWELLDEWGDYGVLTYNLEVVIGFDPTLSDSTAESGDSVKIFRSEKNFYACFPYSKRKVGIRFTRHFDNDGSTFLDLFKRDREGLGF